MTALITSNCGQISPRRRRDRLGRPGQPVSAPQSMQQILTVLQNDGPNHFGLWLIRLLDHLLVFGAGPIAAGTVASHADSGLLQVTAHSHSSACDSVGPRPLPMPAVYAHHRPTRRRLCMLLSLSRPQAASSSPTAYHALCPPACSAPRPAGRGSGGRPPGRRCRPRCRPSLSCSSAALRCEGLCLYLVFPLRS